VEEDAEIATELWATEDEDFEGETTVCDTPAEALTPAETEAETPL
jgi:hypothetical protein